MYVILYMYTFLIFWFISMWILCLIIVTVEKYFANW